MRTTVTLDDDLLETATKWTGIKSKTDLLNHVLREFLQREAGRRLADLGGSMPGLEYPVRSVRYDREVSPYMVPKVAEDPT
mgnify:CR=1 FL=1